ncbi:MAG: hypothetical protein V4850_33145 [Myxococcota bacterium]
MAQLRRDASFTEKESGKPPVNDDWNPGSCAEAIRKTLVTEQQGLCAYCMGRIEPHGFREELAHLGGMKIEHWAAREDHPREMYDWGNLLGVCGGVYNGPDGPVKHCDASRGSTPLHVHPARRLPDPQAVFTYDKAGNIIGNTPGAVADVRTLNLSADRLTENRGAVVDALRKRLMNRDDAATLRGMYRTAITATASGLPAYAPVAARYLAKKLQQRGLVP